MRKFTDAELELAPKVAEVMKTTILHDGTAPLIPLEYDCLEWLREQEWLIEKIHNMAASGAWYIRLANQRPMLGGGPGFSEICPTLLEALYRCIIEVGSDA